MMKVCGFIICFCSIYFFGFKELSVRANEIPFLDVESDSETFVLKVFGSPEKSQRIEFKNDHSPWAILASDAGKDAWSFPISNFNQRRLFRVVESVRPRIFSHSSWKPSLDFPEEPFLSENLGESFEVVKWVKFAILTDDSNRVYFQDSKKYLFHYDFAKDRLKPFRGMTAEEFNDATLYLGKQIAILGAVLVAPYSKEYAVQFIGQDLYPKEMMKFLFETVKNSINGVEEWDAYLMPVPTQASSIQADVEYYQENNIAIANPDRWSGQSGCYVPGWAIGRLRYIKSDDINDAYLSGDLKSTDILLTDFVPSEVPFVAGILSLTPTTPNSHVSILAQSYGIPFAYIKNSVLRAEVMSLVDSLALLRTSSGYWGSCNLEALDASSVSNQYLNEILELKKAPELDLNGKANKGAIAIKDLSRVLPSDNRYIGGKAANFGFLRRVVPNNSPEAIAFTFDLWDQFMDQPMENKTLREEINSRIEPFSSWPTDLVGLDKALRDIRNIIRKASDFSNEQKSAILNELSVFSPNAKIRFRSSTNVEDTRYFVGAGLYDSFSGCILDDTDNDDIGPSHCDPDEPNERGVFRAIRKVYASFYNLNAYLERLRHGVNESEVGMALLVHNSFPDEIEIANGVATLVRGPSGRSTRVDISMVTQKGAVSVTNPEGGAIPEVVDGYLYRGSSNYEGVNLQQRSSLLLLGDDAVMGWEDDYLSLIEMLYQISQAYIKQFPENQEPHLEFEYKKVHDGELVIKQIREIPINSSSGSEDLAIIGSPSGLMVFQGEYGTVMGNHRLKSLWHLEGENRWVNPQAERDSFIDRSAVEIALDQEITNIGGKPSVWPNHRFRIRESGNQAYARDSWIWNSEYGKTNYWLDGQMPNSTQYEKDPVRGLSQINYFLGADYKNAVPVYNSGFGGVNQNTTKNDTVKLVHGHPSDPVQEGSMLQTRSFSSGKLSIETQFYWPPYPKGPTAGYTSPLEKWVQTTITGLTDQPIILRGYFSQTYRPGHHNFWEDFVFEPSLDKDLDSSQRSQLEKRNVRQILLFTDPWGQAGTIKLIGLNGKLRDP
ncbi:MAG: PEP/pyruvate-binding domain-containing protein [Verrucomicrobiota bacterium]|nr:PEP/pyruvate-binding domain-containing protein [Verrucomicrobiota bacterium]